MRTIQLWGLSAIAMLLTSCSAAFQSAAIGDDIYNTHSRTAIAQKQQRAAEVAAAEAESRRAQWEARLAEARAAAAEQEYYENTIANATEQYQSAKITNIVADDYESAYARRLLGFESPTYRMPSSYYALRYSDAFNIASTYDPSYYNVMVAGNEVWVEPKYVTSMFGSWGASIVSPYSSWYFGWSYPRYWNNWWYGYPHYGWYDYGWWDPYWGYFPPHHHHHYPHYGGGGYHHHWQPNVVHRPTNPSIGGRPGTSHRPPMSSGSNIGSSRNHNAQYRGGTVTGSGQYRGSSQNRNNTQYRGGSSSQYKGSANNSSNSNYNSRNENNSFRSPSTDRGFTGGYGGGGGMSSGSSHGGGQRRR